MIQQFAELGRFFRQREGVGTEDKDRLALYVADPAQKFRSKTVLLLVFSANGFERVEVEEYDASKKLWYLYRVGPPNGWDATPTTGIPALKKDEASQFAETIRKKLLRLSNSTADAIKNGGTLPNWEAGALELIRENLALVAQKDDLAVGSATGLRSRVVEQIKNSHSPDSKGGAILTVAWRQADGKLERVGDFVAFQNALIQSGEQSASKKKGIEGDVRGVGQCCICGRTETEVSGLLQVPQFKLYTLDKPGSVSGGFDPSSAWKNFPACRQCCEQVDFAGERIKKYLSFRYYSAFKYLFLPLPVRPQPTSAFELLNRLVDAHLSQSSVKRLTDAEDELFYVVSELENNLLQIDLLFYQPDPQSFRPALYVSGLLPSRFKALFVAKDRVDAHPWLKRPSPKAFAEKEFTFGSLNEVFPHAHGGSHFDDDFLAATRAALELRAFPAERLLRIGMRWVQHDYQDGARWEFRLADLFRSILFFQELTESNAERSAASMEIDYGHSEQAERVRTVFRDAPGKLRHDASVQSAFLVGACCGRIEKIQEHVRGSSPFSGKLKGFRLKQSDVQSLFVAAKEKAKAYGPDEEAKVSGLLECAAAALAATPDRWPLSADEVSYFFALGHALRPRLAKDQEEREEAPPSTGSQKE